MLHTIGQLDTQWISQKILDKLKTHLSLGDRAGMSATTELRNQPAEALRASFLSCCAVCCAVIVGLCVA